ncbi:MAG: site-specific DNA-methyltransferase [Chloroflexi bacterium]|nr:site-specific DNA-methyltransferase [Chloroflexota bacterium]
MQPERGERFIDISHRRTCDCPPSHISCTDAKSWIKGQLGVWQFNYNGRDIRDKKVHPATFPIALARRWIDLLTHRGELVLDPFVGTGTTLVAAQDSGRNAVGFDLHPDYIQLARERLQQPRLDTRTQQFAINADAREIPEYLPSEVVSLIVTSPPYANLLNRPRKNKSRRGQERRNDQYLKVEQYSSDPRDLGLLELEQYAEAMALIFGGLLPLLKLGAHCVIDVPDMWWEDRRVTIHVALIEALRKAGYEFRNTVIWDRTNIVNRVGIFGWPNNYITMGTTFEYLLDFRRPPGRPTNGNATPDKGTDGGAIPYGLEARLDSEPPSSELGRHR